MEKKLRAEIMNECLEYRGNFHNIDILMKYKNDYIVAKREGDYDFDFCPSHFECLERLGVTDLCETNSGIENSIEECRECWRQALLLSIV